MKDSRELIQKPSNEPVELEHRFEPQIVATGRYPAYRGSDVQEGFQLLDYWRAIRKRLWLVIGIAVLATTLAAIYMARKPNVFMANATIQVDLEQNNPDLVTSDRQRPMSNGDPSYFNTQLQLLSSDTLLRRVVKEHNLDSNKEFVSTKNETSTLRSMLKALGLASDPKTREPDADELAANSSLVSADEIAEAVRLAPFVDAIRKNMGIEPVRESRATVKDTRLIEISFRHTSPELAAFVVNSIGETFVNANQEKRTGTSRKTSDFLQQRIAELQSDVARDEAQLVQLKESEGILKSGEGDQTIVLERLAGLNRQLLEAENRRKEAEAKYFSVKNNPEAARMLAEAENARFITERENTLMAYRNDTAKNVATLRATRAKLLLEYKESAPEIKDIDTQIESLEQSLNKVVDKNDSDVQNLRNRTSKVLLENLRTKYQQELDQENKIRTAFNAQYNEAQGQNAGAVKLKLLEQNIETNKGFLENLRKNQSSNDVASQGTDNNIRVEAFAIPPETPVSPSRLTAVMAAFFLSTLFGMGLALVLEYLDDTIKSTEEIETYLQLPALAAIPMIDAIPKRKLLLVGANQDPGDPANSELLINADPRSSLAEAYRQLRTSILLSTAGHAPKSLLITSSLPSEGKTTTATNTAISLAQTGAKVLIIDADMRRPRLHSVFNISNAEGLSTILSSDLSESKILDMIKTDAGTKLNLLTSGPIPPNPAELIGSEQMADLLKTLQRNFTHVVVDSPPISSFTDGVLLATMVSGVILVVHSGRSSRQVVRRSRQLLQTVGAKIFGVVLNNVNLNSQDNYYYRSYYNRDQYRSSDEAVD